MPGLLKIKDACLSFDLRDLLGLVSQEGPKWQWALFPMGESTEITGGTLPEDLPFKGLTVWEFCRTVDAAAEGVALSWVQLNTFACAVHQTIWGTSIGCVDRATFSDLKALYSDEWCYIDRATDEYYERVEIAFQAVDCSFWLVYAKDDTILNHIASAFTDVEILKAR